MAQQGGILRGSNVGANKISINLLNDEHGNMDTDLVRVLCQIAAKYKLIACPNAINENTLQSAGL